MFPDTLAATPAVVDSAAVVNATAGFVGPFVHAWLSGFKNLSPEIVDGLTALATSAATVSVLAVLRWALVLLTRASSTFRAILSPAWDRNRGWLNPVLAIVLGHFDGSALAGALAVAIHAGYRGAAKAAGKTTPQGVARAARTAGAFILAATLATLSADVARADAPKILSPLVRSDLPVSWASRERMAFSIAFGAKANGWAYSRGTQGFAEAQAAYQVTNAIGLRLGVRRVAVAGAPYEPEAKVVLTFAP